MSGILFLVRKFCNVEIMPMVVVGRWRHKGGPHEPHPMFIFQIIFISNLITMIKRELREPVAKFDIIPIFDPNLRVLAKHCLFYYPMFVNGAFATLCFVSIVPIGPLKNICFRFRVTAEKRLRPFFLSAGLMFVTNRSCMLRVQG